MTERPGRRTRGLVLVEPHAATLGGHHSRALVLLARAAQRAGRPCVVVAVNDIAHETQAELERVGARSVRRPSSRRSRTGALIRCADILHAWHEATLPLASRAALPSQLLHLSRCVAEIAALRLGREALASDGPATNVILTANETLHATTAALARAPHVRYVHGASCYEGRAIRVVERLLRRKLRDVHAFCTTAGVSAALRGRYPTIQTAVHPFALQDPGAYVEAAEREHALTQLGLPAGRVVGSLVGGWWRVKDMSTVTQALRRLTQPFTLLVAGHPVKKAELADMSAAHRGEVRILDRPMTSSELRHVYAASDFTIVSRVPNETESGIVLDAAAYGVPLITSDHDEALTRKLEGQPWARVFRRGDPESLAKALADVCVTPLPRPPRVAAAHLGMVEADEMLDAFDRAID